MWKFGFRQLVFHSTTHWKQRMNTQAKLLSSKLMEGYDSVSSPGGLTWGSDDLDSLRRRQGFLNPPFVVQFQQGLWSRLGLEQEEATGAGVEIGRTAGDWRIYRLSFAMDIAGLMVLWGCGGVWCVSLHGCVATLPPSGNGHGKPCREVQAVLSELQLF